MRTDHVLMTAQGADRSPSLLLIGNHNLFIITKVVDKKKGFINQSIQKKGLLIGSYLILTHVILSYLLPMPLILQIFRQLH